ncbi:17S U2 SnRNP complex component HTATSF1-like [Clytia hemisphaerica]|uniref:17S U2 SnRNP complex component HTATSF1 n=1 Tax=Clytia hemisphaerica TaxID=252671 RepID=A0A7M5WSS4_9CNID
MSDVSEHDSDSDTEILKKEEQSNKQQLKTHVISSGPQIINAPQVYTQPSETPTSTITTEKTESAGSAADGNVLDELKHQAESAVADQEKPEWQKYLDQNQQTGAYTYTDPNDGTVYEWDETKRGWIPKIDEDFIAMYQANYGFTATGEHDPNVNAETDEKPGAGDEKNTDDDKTKKSKAADPSTSNNSEIGKKRKAAEQKKEWFDIDPKKNNNVYVSGLPESTSEEEFEELMSKCGIIMDDDTGKKKLKLYKTPDGKVKGDGRCCYLKHESVVLACQLLDEGDFKGSKIKVELAVFELKGQFDPNKKPKKKKKKIKKGKGQDKLLDWVDRPKKRSKFDRIVILKNMFNVKDFERDPSLINDLKTDLRTECGKFGDVKKVIIFDRNPEGIASILFHEPEMADECIQTLNGRFYGGRTISAATYDGVTSYKIEETKEELEKRLDEWEKFIGGDDDDDDDDATVT